MGDPTKKDSVKAEDAFAGAGKGTKGDETDPPAKSSQKKKAARLAALEEKPNLRIKQQFEIPEVGTITLLEIRTRELTDDPANTAGENYERFTQTDDIDPEKLLIASLVFKLPLKPREKTAEQVVLPLEKFYRYAGM